MQYDLIAWLLYETEEGYISWSRSCSNVPRGQERGNLPGRHLGLCGLDLILSGLVQHSASAVGQGCISSEQQKCSTQLWGVLIWKWTFQIIFISVAQTIKSLPAMQQTWVWSLSQEDSLEKGMLPTPVFLPGEFRGQRSLERYSPWGCKELEYNWATNTLHTKYGLYKSPEA